MNNLERIARLSKDLRKPCPASQHVPDKTCGRCKGEGYVELTFEEVIIKVWQMGGSIRLFADASCAVEVPGAKPGHSISETVIDEKPDEETILAGVVHALGGDE